MNKLLILLLIVLSKNVSAQINIKIVKCKYDGRNINLLVEIINKGDLELNIEVDSTQKIVQMPYNSKGDEFTHRINSNIPDAFILGYINDTLIKDFKFYWQSLPVFTKLNIPPKSSIKREYFVTVIGDKTRALLDTKSNKLLINFFLVFKMYNRNANARAKPVKVKYFKRGIPNKKQTKY